MYSRAKVLAAACLGMLVFGIGAVGVPFTLGVLLGRFSYTAITAGVGAAVLIPIVYSLAIRFPAPKHAQGIPLAQVGGLVRQPALLLFGTLLFFQSGMEITVGGWSATFAREVLGLAAQPGLLFLSLYWFGMMLARLVLSGALKRVPPTHALLASIAVALAGAFLLVGARGVGAASVGIFLIGAGFAAVFPLVLGLVGDRYPALSATAFSIAISMALVGGMTLPYVTGLLGDRHGLRASFLVIPASLVAQTVVFALVRRRAVAAAPVSSTGDGSAR